MRYNPAAMSPVSRQNTGERTGGSEGRPPGARRRRLGPLVAATVVVVGGGTLLFLALSGRRAAPPDPDLAPLSGRGVAPIGLEQATLDAREPTPAERVARLADIGSDEWESEVVCAAADGQLGALERALADPAGAAPAELAAVVAGGFSCPDLRPRDLETVLDDGRLRVRRAPAGGDPASVMAQTHTGASGLARALAALRAELGRGARVRAELEISRYEAEADTFTTRVEYRADGRRETGTVQQSATWLCRWLPVGPDQGPGCPPPRLASIALERYEEVELDAPGGSLFVDCTESALGADPSYVGQVLPGIDDWLLRVSRIVDMSIGGHHGLAVADIDGDGLEDLYVCDAGGLPNRVYLQNEDGTLRDVSATSGADWLEYTASALLVDLDGDRDPDLALVTRGGLVIMENAGRGVFTLRQQLPGPVDPMSMSAADYDQDGDVDLFVCGYTAQPDSEGPGAPLPYHDANNGDANQLWRSEGHWHFTDVTAAVGLDLNNRRYSFAAAWEDYDDDGDLDLYVANDFGRNNLYRNDGGHHPEEAWHFTDVAAQARVEDVASGMSAAWGDYDRDGRMDVYVSNMFSPPGGRVTHQPRFAAAQPGAATDVQRMARGNTLLRNAGDGTFRDVSVAAGAHMGGWAWASKFADVNNDGWQDLLVTNGYFTMRDPVDIASFFWRQVVFRSPPLPCTKEQLDDYVAAWGSAVGLVARERSFAGNERNTALLNCGDGRFADVSAPSGLDFREDGRGLALVDWDQDGDLDLWLRNRTGPRLRLMLNAGDPRQTGQRWVSLLLSGTTCNSAAIGARAEVLIEAPSAGRLVRTVSAGDGFISQSSRWLHFGLGSEGLVRNVVVRWPGGATEAFTGVRAGGRYVLRQGSARAEPIEGPARSLALAPSTQPPHVADPAARAYLASRMPMPILRYAGLADAAERAIEVRARPLLVLLWTDWWGPCIEELEELTRNAGDLRAAGVDVLALWVDSPARPAQRGGAPENARRVLERLGFPFESGRATPELLDKVALVQELLFELMPPFGVPFNMLCDASGNLAVFYRGPVAADLLLADVAKLDVSPEERQNLSVPFPGRWFGYGGDLDMPRVANWFFERYPEDTVRYLSDLHADDAGGGQAASHFRLAEALAKAGNAQEAVAAYERALELAPSHVAGHVGLGLVHLSLGQRAQARECYLRALAIDPDDPQAHHYLGHVHQVQGELDLAVQHYTRALELRPALYGTHNNLGNTYRAQGRIDEAIEHYLAALELRPGLAVAHYNLADIYRLQGRTDEAIGRYRSAIEAAPDLAAAHLSLGMILASAGRGAEALPALAEAARLSPDQPGPLARMASVLTADADPAVRNPARAVELAERAAELSGQADLSVLKTLTEAYRAAGRMDSAAATAGRAYDVAVASGNQSAAAAIRAWLSTDGR